MTDPIHFFDESGVSALKREMLEVENAKLAAEVARLQRLVGAMQRRLRQTDPAFDNAPRVTH